MLPIFAKEILDKLTIDESPMGLRVLLGQDEHPEPVLLGRIDFSGDGVVCEDESNPLARMILMSLAQGVALRALPVEHTQVTASIYPWGVDYVWRCSDAPQDAPNESFARLSFDTLLMDWQNQSHDTPKIESAIIEHAYQFVRLAGDLFPGPDGQLLTLGSALSDATIEQIRDVRALDIEQAMTGVDEGSLAGDGVTHEALVSSEDERWRKVELYNQIRGILMEDAGREQAARRARDQRPQ